MIGSGYRLMDIKRLLVFGVHGKGERMMGNDVQAMFEAGMRKRKANQIREEKIAAGTVINPGIDARLLVWGEWHLGRHAECGGCGSMLGALIAGGGELIRATASGSDMPDDVYDTDRAVMNIQDKYRAVIFEQYLELNKTAAERAKSVGCAVGTYYRWLSQAQQQVLFYLKPVLWKSPVRDQMLKKSTVEKECLHRENEVV